MIDFVILVISFVLMTIGCVFVVSGAVGMVRMPDLYTRLHAASLTDTGGAIFISLALIIQSVFVFGSAMAAIKVTLILIFTLFTSPTASHALAKTALLSGLVPTNADGKPILESSEEATHLARSRKANYRSGEDGEAYRRSMRKAADSSSSGDQPEEKN